MSRAGGIPAVHGGEDVNLVTRDPPGAKNTRSVFSPLDYEVPIFASASALLKPELPWPEGAQEAGSIGTRGVNCWACSVL